MCKNGQLSQPKARHSARARSAERKRKRRRTIVQELVTSFDESANQACPQQFQLCGNDVSVALFALGHLDSSFSEMREHETPPITNACTDEHKERIQRENAKARRTLEESEDLNKLAKNRRTHERAELRWNCV